MLCPFGGGGGLVGVGEASTVRKQICCMFEQLFSFLFGSQSETRDSFVYVVRPLFFNYVICKIIDIVPEFVTN